jgi:hypothetical protein
MEHPTLTAVSCVRYCGSGCNNLVDGSGSRIKMSLAYNLHAILARTDVAATELQKMEASDDSILRRRASATVDGIHLSFADHTRASRTVNMIEVCCFSHPICCGPLFGHAQEQSTVGAIFLAELAFGFRLKREQLVPWTRPTDYGTDGERKGFPWASITEVQTWARRWTARCSTSTLWAKHTGIDKDDGRAYLHKETDATTRPIVSAE